MKIETSKEKNESKLKHLTGADLIIGLFLIVAVPHNSFTLIKFESADWWPLGWLLAAAIDVGIAYGAAISSQTGADKEARRWATVLFVGLSVGSYSLNAMHYLEYGASWYSLGLGAFFPIGIMLLAKIKSRLVSTDIAEDTNQNGVEYFPQGHQEKRNEEHPITMTLTAETMVERLEDEIKNEERWKLMQPEVELSSAGFKIPLEEVRKIVRAFRRGTLTNEEFEEESSRLLAGKEEAVRLEELLKLGRAFRNKKLTAGEVDRAIAGLFSTERSQTAFEKMRLKGEEAL